MDPSRPLERPELIASTDGVRVALHDLGGAPSAPSLLVAHANGFHSHCYTPMVAAGLAEQYHVIGVDLRGHGDATLPAQPITGWWGFGDDAGAAAARLGRPLLGFGHSLGGASLLMAELANPGTFSMLYLYEPIVPPPGGFDLPPGLASNGDGAGDNPMAAGAARRRQSFASFEEAIANYAAKPPLSIFTPEALDAYVNHGFALQDDGTVTLKCHRDTEAAIFRSAGHGVFDRLDEIRCAVVVAAGEDAGFGPSRFAAPVTQRLALGRLERFDDLGHFGPMEAPARIAAAVLAAFTGP